MRKTFIVASREYLAAVRTKSFIISLILLPIMIYRPLQLILCSILADRWARRAGE